MRSVATWHVLTIASCATRPAVLDRSCDEDEDSLDDLHGFFSRVRYPLMKRTLDFKS
jgi:hypothetical protein